jgi:hypothetical protein
LKIKLLKSMTKYFNTFLNKNSKTILLMLFIFGLIFFIDLDEIYPSSSKKSMSLAHIPLDSW